MRIPELFADSNNQGGIFADSLLPVSEREKSREEFENMREEWEKAITAKSLEDESETDGLHPGEENSEPGVAM